MIDATTDPGKRPSTSDGLGEPLLERAISFGVVSLSMIVVIGLLLAVIGVYTPWASAGTVLLSVAIGAWSASRINERALTRLPTVVIIVGCLIAGGSALLQAHYSAEHLVVDRDQGVYLDTAQWLRNHGDLLIEGRVGPFDGVDSVNADWLGFYDVRDDGLVYAQFSHGFPVALATVGMAAGTTAMLATNALLQAAVLLLILVVAAQIARPWIALVAMGATAANLAFSSFFRDTFTEPLVLLLVLGAMIAMLATARNGTSVTLSVAGLALGATAAVRIDSWLIVGAWLLLLAMWIVGERRPSVTVRAVVVAVGILLFTGGVGVVDLVLRSPRYVSDRVVSVAPMAVVTLVCLGMLLVASLFRQRLRAVLASPRSGRARSLAGKVSGSAVVIVSAFGLLIRPRYFVAHGGYTDFVASATESLGVRDGTRTMAELTMSWFTWYWGWLAVVLAVAGIALALVRPSGRWSVAGIGLAMSSLMLAVYLVRPSITPDHVWAMRRFLTPGTIVVVIGVAVAMEALVRWLDGRSSLSRLFATAVPVVIAGALVVLPLIPSMAMITFARQDGLLLSTMNLCEALPARSAVVVEPGRLGVNHASSVRAFCDVPTVTLDSEAGPRELGVVSRAVADRGYVPVFLSLDGGFGTMIASDSFLYPESETPINRPPSRTLELEHRWVLERLG
jgi:hypothetical protein